MTTAVHFSWLWRVVLWIWLATIGFLTLPTFAYDSQSQSQTGDKVGYDDTSLTTAEYDGVAVSSAHDSESDIVGIPAPFIAFSKFLAAEGGGQQIFRVVIKFWSDHSNVLHGNPFGKNFSSKSPHGRVFALRK